VIVVVTIVAMALSFQPLQGPHEKGAPKGGGTQDAATSEHANKSQEPPHPASVPLIDPATGERIEIDPETGERIRKTTAPVLPTASQPTAVRNETDADRDASGVNIQRKIEVFTGVLAVVGVFQLAVMFLTWRVYARQAGIMEQQRATMQSQWTTMQGQLEAIQSQIAESKQDREMFVSKERPRLMVELCELELPKETTEDLWFLSVDYQVFIYGITPAFIEESGVNFWLSDSATPPSRRGIGRLVKGKIITPTDQPIKDTAIGFSLITDKPTVEKIMEGKQHIHFSGHVRYRDVFGKVYETRLRKLWHFSDHKNLDGTRWAYWKDSGQEEDNRAD
jgi:hypothetical protein